MTAGLKGDITSLASFTKALAALPRTLAINVAADAAPKLTAVAHATFEAGENAYGTMWTPLKTGERATLKKTGGIEGGVFYVAIGTKLRVKLGVPYAKFQVGRRPIFPRQGQALPVAYVQVLAQSAKDTIARELGGRPVIREIAREAEAVMTSMGVPFAVVAGPESTETTTWGRERIVIGYDPDAADSFAPARGVHLNPKSRFQSAEACVARIYARSTQAGASVFEHRRRVKLARDKLVWALFVVSRKRKNTFSPQSGRLFIPDDLKDTEREAGAAYELRFTFTRGLDNRTWQGAAAPEIAVGGKDGLPVQTREVLVEREDGDPTDDDTAAADTDTEL